MGKTLKYFQFVLVWIEWVHGTLLRLLGHDETHELQLQGGLEVQIQILSATRMIIRA
jgi:hypothetical protein